MRLEPMTAEQRILRAKIARKSRSRQPDDPELLAARREFAVSRLTTTVERLLAAAPPLTEPERERLAAVILRGAPDEVVA